MEAVVRSLRVIGGDCTRDSDISTAQVARPVCAGESERTRGLVREAIRSLAARLRFSGAVGRGSSSLPAQLTHRPLCDRGRRADDAAEQRWRALHTATEERAIELLHASRRALVEHATMIKWTSRAHADTRRWRPRRIDSRVAIRHRLSRVETAGQYCSGSLSSSEFSTEAPRSSHRDCFGRESSLRERRGQYVGESPSVGRGGTLRSANGIPR